MGESGFLRGLSSAARIRRWRERGRAGRMPGGSVLLMGRLEPREGKGFAQGNTVSEGSGT